MISLLSSTLVDPDNRTRSCRCVLVLQHSSIYEHIRYANIIHKEKESWTRRQLLSVDGYLSEASHRTHSFGRPASACCQVQPPQR